MIDLKEIYNKGWWVKVSPLAKIDKECWVCSIYKKGKNVGNFAFEYDAKNSIDRKLKL